MILQLYEKLFNENHILYMVLLSKLLSQQENNVTVKHFASSCNKSWTHILSIRVQRKVWQEFACSIMPSITSFRPFLSESPKLRACRFLACQDRVSQVSTTKKTSLRQQLAERNWWKTIFWYRCHFPSIWNWNWCFYFHKLWTNVSKEDYSEAGQEQKFSAWEAYVWID